MSSRSNFIFGPFADSAWKQPKIASHADPAVARHLFAKTPQRTTRALCVAAMRELRLCSPPRALASLRSPRYFSTRARAAPCFPPTRLAASFLALPLAPSAMAAMAELGLAASPLLSPSSFQADSAVMFLASRRPSRAHFPVSTAAVSPSPPEDRRRRRCMPPACVARAPRPVSRTSAAALGCAWTHWCSPAPQPPTAWPPPAGAAIPQPSSAPNSRQGPRIAI